ncbi:hypothetical protein [Flavobacterium sp. A45]|uniref:hypothetical protein n=1 Tax=Flavobacterium sp. A45 TaxID=1945862 RepID=UPI000986D30E|nr:hypothetical protein [Flavobacterium sp. A45]OOG74534.1 hypothetical protein B0E44_05920 [Flavobacterium sp. A45]
MTNLKIIISFIFLASIISCGKNKENEEHELEQTKEPNYEQKTPENPEIQKKDTIYVNPEDSIKAVKHSILRKQNFKKKEQTGKSEDNLIEIPEIAAPSTPDVPAVKKAKAPSFVYIKKILNECEIGKTMTQEDLQHQFNIPKEAIQLVKTVTKISENELDIKWKSTWLIEKMSDAKFKDGRLKVRFEKNKMYTSGGAIGIKYEKKMYTDLYLIGRSAYIPTVKGYYWQIGKDK